MTSMTTPSAHSGFDLYASRSEPKTDLVEPQRNRESQNTDDKSSIPKSDKDFEKKLDDQQDDQELEQEAKPTVTKDDTTTTAAPTLHIQDPRPVLLQVTEQAENDELTLRDLQGMPLFPDAHADNNAEEAEELVSAHISSNNNSDTTPVDAVVNQHDTNQQETHVTTSSVTVQTTSSTDTESESKQQQSQQTDVQVTTGGPELHNQNNQQFTGQQQERHDNQTSNPMTHMSSITENPSMDEEVEGIRPLADIGKVKIAAKPITAAPMQMVQQELPMDKAMATQVSRATLQQISDGQRSLTLRLTPPELGTVKIEIVQSNAGMQVKLSAEDDGVRASLERALPSLRQELRDNSTVREVQVADQHLDFNKDHQQDRQTSKDDNEPDQEQQQGPQFSLDGDMELPHQADLNPTESDYARPAYVSDQAVNISA